MWADKINLVSDVRPMSKLFIVRHTFNEKFKPRTSNIIKQETKHMCYNVDSAQFYLFGSHMGHIIVNLGLRVC